MKPDEKIIDLSTTEPIKKLVNGPINLTVTRGYINTDKMLAFQAFLSAMKNGKDIEEGLSPFLAKR